MAKILITPRSFSSYSQKPLERLRSLGLEIVYNDSGGMLSQEDMIKLIKDVDGVILGVDPLNKAVIDSAEKLSVVSRYGVGLDNVDLEACSEKGIDVQITKNANSSAVADYAFALMLCVARRVAEIDQACKNNNWSKKTGVDVFGKKIGILGLGSIGKGVAQRAAGFGMQVYAYDVFTDEIYADENKIKYTSVENIFKVCDFISLHLPLNDDTRNLVDEKLLKSAKLNLIIVNTARGGIINETDLYNALKSKQIYGAGIDVFEKEPPKDSPLLSLDNVIVGAHSAASSIGAVDSMSEIAVDNLIKSLEDKKII